MGVVLVVAVEVVAVARQVVLPRLVLVGPVAEEVPWLGQGLVDGLVAEIGRAHV